MVVTYPLITDSLLINILFKSITKNMLNQGGIEGRCWGAETPPALPDLVSTLLQILLAERGTFWFSLGKIGGVSKNLYIHVVPYIHHRKSPQQKGISSTTA